MSVKSESASVKPTSKGLSLRANFSWTFAGNLANALSQFGVLLALARLGTPEMTGQYGLALAITAPIFLFAGMSLRNVQVTDIRDEYTFRDYAAVRFQGMVLALLVVVLIVSLLGYSATTAAVIVFIGLSKAIEGLSDIIFGVFHKHEQMDRIAKSMMIKAGLSVSVFAAVLWTTGDLVLSVLSISVVWLLRLLAYDVPNLLSLRGDDIGLVEFAKESLRAIWHIPKRRSVSTSLLVLSFPVAISTSLISLNTNIPRYVLEWTAGAAELGIFTVLAYPLVAGNIIISALSQSSLPRLAKYFSTGQINRFTALLKRLLAFSATLAVAALLVAAAIGEEVLDFLFGAEYASAESTLIVLIVGMGVGFANWFLNASLHATRAYSSMMRIQITMVPVQFGLALVLVPAAGLIGAAWVTVCSLIIQVAMKAYVVAGRIRRAGIPKRATGVG